MDSANGFSASASYSSAFSATKDGDGGIVVVNLKNKDATHHSIHPVFWQRSYTFPSTPSPWRSKVGSFSFCVCLSFREFRCETTGCWDLGSKISTRVWFVWVLFLLAFVGRRSSAAMYIPN